MGGAPVGSVRQTSGAGWHRERHTTSSQTGRLYFIMFTRPWSIGVSQVDASTSQCVPRPKSTVNFVIGANLNLEMKAAFAFLQYLKNVEKIITFCLIFSNAVKMQNLLSFDLTDDISRNVPGDLGGEEIVQPGRPPVSTDGRARTVRLEHQRLLGVGTNGGVNVDTLVAKL
jgi:hypothetical protein